MEVSQQESARQRDVKITKFVLFLDELYLQENGVHICNHRSER